MFLFLGTRPGKQISQKLTGVSCPYCSQSGTLTVLSTANYFHLFWIPLFKIGSSRFAECSHCKRSYYKEEFSAEMERALDGQ